MFRAWTPKIVTSIATEQRQDAREAVMGRLAALEIEMASRRRHGIAAMILSLVEQLTGITTELPAHEVWGEDIRAGVQRWTVILQESVAEMAQADARLEELMRRDMAP